MKPGQFWYHRPDTRDEVDALLTELGDEAKVLAGGQSLVPLLNMRLATPTHLIDINRLEHEESQPAVAGQQIAFTPLVRHDAAQRSQDVLDNIPVLAAAMAHVGHPPIRSRGTVVGSIAHADPAAELPAVLLLLGGEVRVRCGSGTRVIPGSSFFTAPFATALKEDEWVEEVRFDVSPAASGFAFVEFARRSGDFALCGVAAGARLTDVGTVMISLAYCGVAPCPVRFELPPLGPQDVKSVSLDDAVAELILQGLDPPQDVQATRQYRMWLARKLGVLAARRATAVAENRSGAR